MLRTRAVAALAVVVGVLLATLPSAATATAYPDPQTVTGDTAIHDPTMIRLKDGSYVAYSTHGRLEARVSKDRTHWERAAVDAFATPPAWWYAYNDTADPWAPEITYRAGTYWLYYSLSSWGSNHSAIGVATSASGRPGTWTDRGKVFASETGDAWNAIDPYVVEDGDQLWMAFGSYWSGIRMIRLDPRTGKAHTADTAVRHLATRPDLPYAVEAPAIVKHGAYWYLFNSYDACCSGLSATYKIKVGRATSLTGPYTDSGGTPMLRGGGDLLLAGHGRYIGPGGQSLMRDRGADVLVHHYYDGEDDGAPKLGLNELRWGEDGWPSVV
ncbi:arabinan endo-1,5-alpha-L-arabinosidase [Streptomyces sp. NPDC058620]|uniref:arabinan endo-1,5-alpha-L-arabinosidase n=1 Tax=Streptomyces sp. NPDC058620 TaxID=3346560 RepID=UPI00364FA0CC